jgi:hypothetical protein
MARSDGFRSKITKHQRTNILPFRWAGNTCSHIATNSLVKAFDLQGHNDGYRFKFHCFIWKHFNKPYEKWGTYYEMDTSGWKEEITDSDSLES